MLDRARRGAPMAALAVSLISFASPALAATTIDATALTETSYRVADVNAGAVVASDVPTASPQSLDLPAGDYALQTASGFVAFSVDGAGVATVAAGSANAASALGTTLTVTGFTFTFDATGVSDVAFAFFGAALGNWVNQFQPSNVPYTATLLPSNGEGYVYVGVGAAIPFAISGAGSLTSSYCPSCFEQLANRTVVVHGASWTFDATALSEPEVVFFGATARSAGWATATVPSSAPFTFSLLPGGTYYFMTYGSQVELTVQPDGSFTNLSTCAGCFVVDAANRRVTVPGFRLTFDTSAQTAADFAIFGTNGRLANWSTAIFPTAGAPRTFTLLPGGSYTIETNGGAASFTPSSTGAFTDLSACPGCWGVNGTSIAVRGFTFDFQADALTEQEIVFFGHGYHRAGYLTDWLRGCGAHSITVLPGDYSLRSHSFAQFFHVANLGALSMTPAPGGWITADPSNTSFTISGYGVRLAAAFPGVAQYNLTGVPDLPGVIATYDNGTTQCLNLGPGLYRFDQTGTSNILGYLTIAADGSLSYSGTPGLTATSNGALCAQSRCVTNRPPDAAITGPASAFEGEVVCLDGSASSDPDHDPLAFQWSLSGAPSGVALVNPNSTHPCFTVAQLNGDAVVTVQLTVCDASSACDTATHQVLIRDRVEPPACGAATLRANLWPPNHKLVPVQINVPSSAGMAIVTVTGVTQDEPLDGLGDGDTGPNDAALGAGGTVQVRAERAGTNKVPGNGRVYRISFTATNTGGTCTGAATLCVPHDQGNRSTCLDDGQRFNSLGGS